MDTFIPSIDLSVSCTDPRLLPIMLRRVEKELKRPAPPAAGMETRSKWDVSYAYFGDKKPLRSRRPVPWMEIWDLESTRVFSEAFHYAANPAGLRIPSDPELGGPYRYRQWIIAVNLDSEPDPSLQSMITPKLSQFVEPWLVPQDVAAPYLGIVLGEMDRLGILDSNTGDSALPIKTLERVRDAIRGFELEATTGESSSGISSIVIANGALCLGISFDGKHVLGQIHGLEEDARDTGDLSEHELARFTDALKAFRGSFWVNREACQKDPLETKASEAERFHFRYKEIPKESPYIF